MENIAPFIIPILTAATALILLVAGGKLLKPAIGLSAGLLGAGAGLMLAPMQESIPPLVSALVLGLVCAIVAVYIAKFAILLLLSVSFACLIPVITWHAADLGDGTKVVQEVVEAATAPVNQSKTNSSDTGTQSTLNLTQDAMTMAFAMLSEDASNALGGAKRRAFSAWNAVPAGPRMMLVGAAVVGLLLGLLVATFLPFLASAIVTSVCGSILLVEAVRNFVTLIWSQQTIASVSPMVMLATISCLALAGLGLQLTLSKKAPKAKEE
jgi:Zn-dependent protease with chaperone function